MVVSIASLLRRGHSCPPAARGTTHPGPALRTSEFLHQSRRHFFQKARRHAGFRQIGSIAPPVDGTAQHKRVHRARHAYVAQAAFFLDIVHFKQRTRVRKEPFFQAAEKHQRELKSLGGMQRHQRDARRLVVSRRHR